MKARHAKKLLKAPTPGFIMPTEEMLEGTASFSLNLQCDQFDPRMKYQKVDFFQSQKVTAPASAFDARMEAAYAYCKRAVLKRFNDTATAITASRHEVNPFPIGGDPTPHPVSRSNARAYEEHQQRRGIGADPMDAADFK